MKLALVVWSMLMVVGSAVAQEVTLLKSLEKGDNSWSTISPDRKTLFNIDQDTGTLVETNNGNKIRTVKGYGRPVFSPDGKILALANNNSVQLLDTSTGQEMLTVADRIDFMFFSPDSTTLALTKDNIIELWNIGNRKQIAILKGHVRELTSVAFSPDGKTLASGGFDGTLKLWDTSSGKEISTLKGVDGVIYALTFSPDSKILASGGFDHTIKLWNTSSGKEINTLQGHDGLIIALAFSPDSKTLASNSSDRTIKLWDASSGKEITSLERSSSDNEMFQFSPDGKILAAPDPQGAIKLWNTKTWKEITKLENGSLQGFSPEGKTLAIETRFTTDLWDTSKLISRDARLFISVDPSDSVVRINGSEVAPSAGGLFEVFSGTNVMVQVEASGYNPFVSNLTVEPNQTRSVNVTLSKQLGSVLFTSEPSGATLTVKGQVKGKTPITLTDLPLEPLQYTLTLEDHQPATGSVNVLGNTTLSVASALREFPSLSFVSHPSGSQVWMSGQMVCAATPCTVKNLKPGPADFMLRLPGYLDFKGRAFVPQEGKGTVEESLTRK